jgi:hypothetical protein
LEAFGEFSGESAGIDLLHPRVENQNKTSLRRKDKKLLRPPAGRGEHDASPGYLSRVRPNWHQGGKTADKKNS